MNMHFWRQLLVGVVVIQYVDIFITLGYTKPLEHINIKKYLKNIFSVEKTKCLFEPVKCFICQNENISQKCIYKSLTYIIFL